MLIFFTLFVVFVPLLPLQPVEGGFVVPHGDFQLALLRNPSFA